MAYFVFRFETAKRPELIDTFGDYRAAKRAVKSLRQETGSTGGFGIRMMFATDEAAARRLLAEKREPRPLGEE